MLQHELVTYMTRPEPGRIGSPGRHVYLPLEMKILTGCNSWLRDGICETKVMGINPNGEDLLIQSCATLDLPDKQHDSLVGHYRLMGYKVVEHRRPLTDVELEGLEELLKGIPGLD